VGIGEESYRGNIHASFVSPLRRKRILSIDALFLDPAILFVNDELAEGLMFGDISAEIYGLILVLESLCRPLGAFLLDFPSVVPMSHMISFSFRHPALL
jgi:hypothetical protein